MSAGKYDFTIEQGATFSETLTWRDSTGTAINLTGYTITSELKRKFSDANPVATFTCTITNAAGGVFTRTLSATLSAALPIAQNSNGTTDMLPLYHDIKAVSGSTVYRIIEGICYVSPRVT